MKKVDVAENVTIASFRDDIYPKAKPVIMKGLVADWPSVQRGQHSSEQAAHYLKTLYNGQQINTLRPGEGFDGRFFYNADLTGVNFTRVPASLNTSLDKLLNDPDDPLYVESTDIHSIMPGFAAENPMSLLIATIPPRIWIGNELTVQTHFDMSQNIACVVSGRRRFILFPPEQLPNLYMGPMEVTPSGVPVSMVDLRHVDYQKFPRFKEAEKAALVADLEPGDAIFIPYLWWHSVQSLTPFNVLVNYWWNEYETRGSPMSALLHSVLTLRDLPPGMRDAWRAMFDQYVFSDVEETQAHLPPRVRGGLGQHDQALRANLWRALAGKVAAIAQRVL